MHIQGDSGGMVNVLGCYSIGYVEEISAYERMTNSELVAEMELFES